MDLMPVINIDRYVQRYAELTGSPSAGVTVFHGTKAWTVANAMKSGSVEYVLARGHPLTQAISYTQTLLEQMTDFANPSILNTVMQRAQETGIWNPFVSASKRREVAQSFALGDGSPGYIVAIHGPQSMFYDFNLIREKCALPRSITFYWLEEMGIPFQIQPPFEVIRVDFIMGIKEIGKCVYEI